MAPHMQGNEGTEADVDACKGAWETRLPSAGGTVGGLAFDGFWKRAALRSTGK